MSGRDNVAEQAQTGGKPMRKCCETCLYVGTRERCSGCLNPQDLDGYGYANWESGDGMARLLAFQRRGERSIVVGWQGGLEVTATDTLAEFRKRAVRVAEQCGYLVGNPEIAPSRHPHCREVRCYTETGCWAVVFGGEPERLVAIDRLPGDGKKKRSTEWSVREGGEQ